jgi:uncharacterized UBP type Zn finger protein
VRRPISDCAHDAAALPAPRGRFLLLRRPASGKKACEACGERENLRVCQTCGYVGCCESHGAHDREHFEKTGHFFIRPRKGADWLWCYGCRAYLQ